MSKKEDLKSLIPEDNIQLSDLLANSRDVINNFSEVFKALINSGLTIEDKTIDSSTDWDKIGLNTVYFVEDFTGENAPSADRFKNANSLSILVTVGLEGKSYQHVINQNLVATRKNNTGDWEYSVTGIEQTLIDINKALEGKAEQSYVNSVKDNLTKLAQYNYIRDLTNDDDLFKVSNGHYRINGTMPKNSPTFLSNSYWADFYSTEDMYVLLRYSSSINAIYICSKASADNAKWTKIQTQEDFDNLQNKINAKANQTDLNSVKEFAKYPVIKTLTSADDVTKLTENGLYISKASSKPQGLPSVIYGNEFYIIKNASNIFLTSDFYDIYLHGYDNQWRRFPNEKDIDGKDNAVRTALQNNIDKKADIDFARFPKSVFQNGKPLSDQNNGFYTIGEQEVSDSPLGNKGKWADYLHTINADWALSNASSFFVRGHWGDWKEMANKEDIASVNTFAKYPYVRYLQNDEDINNLTEKGLYIAKAVRLKNAPWDTVSATFYLDDYNITAMSMYGNGYIKSFADTDHKWKHLTNGDNEYQIQKNIDNANGFAKYPLQPIDSSVLDVEKMSNGVYNVRGEKLLNCAGAESDGKFWGTLTRGQNYIQFIRDNGNIYLKTYLSGKWLDWQTTYDVSMGSTKDYIDSKAGNLQKNTLRFQENTLKDIDIKTYFNSGFYRTHEGNNITGLPSGAYKFGYLINIHTESDVWQYYQDSFGNKFERTCSNGSWTDWAQTQYKDTRDLKDYIDSKIGSGSGGTISEEQLTEIKDFAKYPKIRDLKDGEDLNNLTEKGLYVAKNLTLKNAPWASNITATFYLDEYILRTVSYTGNEFYKQFPNGPWKHVSNSDTESDFNNKINTKASQTDLNTVKDFAKYPLIRDLTNDDDMFSLPYGHYKAEGVTPKGSPWGSSKLYGDFYANKLNRLYISSTGYFYTCQTSGGYNIWRRLLNDNEDLKQINNSINSKPSQDSIDQQNAQTLSQAKNYAKDLFTWRASDNPEYDAQVDPDHVYYQK